MERPKRQPVGLRRDPARRRERLSPIPVVRSVSLAALLTAPDRTALVLIVRRPDEPEEEFPGLWGLPATTLLSDETPDEARRRLARQKLSTDIRDATAVSTGSQERPGYRLDMTVFSGALDREPDLFRSRARRPEATYYDAWRWALPWTLTEALKNGSLCAKVFLDWWRQAAEDAGAFSKGTVRPS